MNHSRIFEAIRNGEKLPRKIKKQVLGRRLNRKALKALLSTVEIAYLEDGQIGDILPFTFCPSCGCEAVEPINHSAEWPEVWEEDRCLRCGRWVGGADNSHYHHVLECGEQLNNTRN